MSGGLKVEQQAHKLGYYKADADGELAPVVSREGEVPEDVDDEKILEDNTNRMEAIMERFRAGGDQKSHRHISNTDVRAEGFREEASGNGLAFDGKAGIISERPDQAVRGFGKGYEVFKEELKNDLNTVALVKHLHEHGYEFVHTSDNAGLYLCEFIYYCSLAEQQRTQQGQNNGGNKKTKILFVHCPPVDSPLSTDEVTDGLKRIISWVIREEVIKK